MPRRRRDKVDSNQPEIVEELRKIHGLSVEVGHDDILVGFAGNTYWYEIKDPSTISPVTGLVRKSAKKDHQKELETSWYGHYRIVTSVDEILDDLDML